MRKTAYFHQRGRWIWISFLVLASALIVTAAIPSSAAAYTQQKKNLSFGQVNINTGTSLGTIPSTALGINDAAWDSHLLDSSIPGMLQQDGVKVMRYPGGSTSDYYHWQSNTVETCSLCGVIVHKGLSVRWHSCPDCGTSLHRDHNAAKNIERLGQSLRGGAAVAAS